MKSQANSTEANSNGAKTVTLRRSSFWGGVPQSLVEDARLSANARLVGIWLCIQHDNWTLVIAHMRKVLGLGRDADLAARRQLVELGYLETRQVKNHDGSWGRLAWEFFPVPTAEAHPPEAAATVSGEPGHGSPAPGKPGHKTGTISKRNKRKPPPPAPETPDADSGGGVSIQVCRETGDVERVATQLGLEGDDASRFRDAAAGASAAQLDWLVQICESSKREGKTKSPVGFAISLARKAAQGLLTSPSPCSEKMESVAQKLESLDSWQGFEISGTNGLIALVEGRSLRTTAGVLLHPQDTMKVIARIESGELQAKPRLST